MNKFDILAYLESLGLKVELRSARRYAYIQCPQCDAGKPHLWINIGDKQKQYGSWGCWKNEMHKGGLKALISHLENVDWNMATQRLMKFSTKIPYDIDKELAKISNTTIETKKDDEIKFSEIELPKKLSSVVDQKNAMKFLKSRGFGEQEIHDWDLQYCHSSKYKNILYKHRIIIPVYQQNKLVAFQGRDITGRQRIKYLSSPLENGAAINNGIYNIDRVDPALVIVTEGILDTWAVGKNNGVCLFGKKIYPQQLKTLYNFNLKCVKVMLDGEAQEEARNIAMDIRTFVPDVDVVELPYNEDPASLGNRELWRILNG
jgi:DNA primase